MTRPLRVVMNASILLAPHAGIGRYVRELGQALQQRDDVAMLYAYAMRQSEQMPEQGLKHYSLLRDLAKCVVPSPYRFKRWLEQYNLKRACRHQQVDLYHEPSLWPHRVDCPTVMTLHDLTHIHYPQTQPADRLRAIEQSLSYALEHARQIICVSAFTAQQAMAHYGIAQQRISVTPLGVSPLFQPYGHEQSRLLVQRLGLQHQRFMLCVGTLEPRKNLELVFRAVSQLPESLMKRFPLVLCGAEGWGNLPASLLDLERKGWLKRTGYLPHQELCLLMSAARMLLFPSLYEGFGLPVVEAMASGTPVITSNCSAMPEVGGDAVVYVDPHDANGLAEAIRRLEEDQASWEQYRQAGLSRAAQYSWARTAELTRQAYQAALSG